MGKSLKRSRFVDNDDYSSHKIKSQKKIAARKKLSDFSSDFDDEPSEPSKYLNDPKAYHAAKEYR